MFNWKGLIRFGSFWFIALTVTLTLAGIGWTYWQWDWLHGSEPGTPASSTLRNVGLLIGGVIALVFAVWRGIVAERQADIAQRQADIAQSQAETTQRQAETVQRQAEVGQAQSEAAQRGLLNERYRNEAEKLGNSVLAVRLGGIYALQQLAEEHPEQYHIQVMRLLCAFVRSPTRDQSIVSGQAAIEPGILLRIRQDVEAIVQAISSRSQPRIALERDLEFRLDLRGADLRDAQFLDADLSYAMFHHAHLSCVNFANTDLSDAFLTHADLSQAEFHEVNFTRTRLWSANLSGAMLLDADLSRIDFRNTNLVGTNLLRANLSGANFQNAKAANAWLELANLSDAGFLGADLSGARFAGAVLSGAHFWDADLNGANFADSDLSGALFSVNGRQPAKKMTQVQLDQARASADNPPKLNGVLDAKTGIELLWQDKPIVPDT